MAISNNVAMVNVAPTRTPRARPAGAPAFGGDTFNSSTAGQLAGAGVGLGFMALAFSSINLLRGGGMIFSVPGMIVGAIGGARIVKFVQDGLKAHVSSGSILGAVAVGGIYAVGGAFMAAAAPALHPAFWIGGTLLAGIAGSTAGGLIDDGISAVFRRLFKRD
jgi:hypothetical protein